MRTLFGTCLIAGLLLSVPAQAKPLHYLLDTTTSSVDFIIAMGASPLKGQMPVSRADLTLDFDRAAASRVKVTLNAAAAKMALPFATTALLGPQILDTAAFPQIVFESTSLKANGEQATVSGKITLRGVTQPITLMAQIFRPQGSAEGQRDRFSIHLTGSVQRSAFGASGYGDMVGDTVQLDITAHIRRAGLN